jgi:hypothetical protein
MAVLILICWRRITTTVSIPSLAVAGLPLHRVFDPALLAVRPHPVWSAAVFTELAEGLFAVGLADGTEMGSITERNTKTTSLASSPPCRASLRLTT